MNDAAEMRIAVVGLGYVGSVEAAVLAASGRTVIGVDVREAVVEAMAAGPARPSPSRCSRSASRRRARSAR